MVLIVKGRTRCPLCDDAISFSDEVVAFPAFLGSHHELAAFSDAAFHQACFRAHAQAADVECLYVRYQQVWASRPRDLQSLDAIEEWGKEAFREFGGVGGG